MFRLSTVICKFKKNRVRIKKRTLPILHFINSGSIRLFPLQPPVPDASLIFNFQLSIINS